MLKLLKLEFIRTWRQFSLIFLVFFGMCFIAGTTLTQATAYLLPVVLFLGIGIFFGTIVMTFIDYQKSMFSNEGYLTLTLPTSTHKLLISKILGSSVWFIVGILVSLSGFFLWVVLFNYTRGEIQFPYPNELFQFLTIKSFTDILLIFNLFFEVVCFITLAFMAITVAHSSYIRNHRILWSIVFLFICAYIPELISWVVPNLGNGIADMLSLEGTIYQLVYLFQNVVIFVGMYCITYFTLELKTEVY